MEDEMPWPTLPDGTNMTIGEMPPEVRERILLDAKKRWMARRENVSPEVSAAIDNIIQKTVAQ